MYFSWLNREVRLYRAYQSVVGTNKAFDDAIEAMESAKKRFEREERQIPLPELKGRLQRAVEHLGEQIDSVQTRRQAYWAEALLEEPLVQRTWSIEVIGQADVTIKRIPPENVVQLEKILHKVKYSDDPTKQIDLDARFQKRTATILRRCLSQYPIPLITISRLVVLIYISAGLTRKINHHLMIMDETGMKVRRRQELTVSAVDQKLRNIGL